MKQRTRLLLAAGMTFLVVGSIAKAQDLQPADQVTVVDGSDLTRQLREREAKISMLSTDDKQKLRAAREKAADDPAVKAAISQRNEAMREFQSALRASMLKSDPAIGPIFEKLRGR